MTLVDKVLERIFEILKAPATEPEMLWIIVPVAISTFLMTFYFGRYKDEELGWNTAFGNTIIMLFSCLDLLRHLYENSLLKLNVETILVIAVLFEGGILMLLNFLHALPKKLAFGISSSMTVNIIILSLIILIYSQLPLNEITAIAVLIIAVAIIILLKLIQLLEWGSDSEDEE